MITSTQNASIRKVSDYLRKKKARDKDTCFVAEGTRLILETPSERIISIYISASFSKQTDADIRRFLQEHQSHTEIVDDLVFKKFSDTNTPQGIMAVVSQSKLSVEDVILGRACRTLYTPAAKTASSSATFSSTAAPESPDTPLPLLLILDGLQDPGNLGTILRSAEAAGATGILLCEGTVDIYSPKVVRSTMGSIYRLPFAHVSDLRATATLLKKYGIQTVAADMTGDTVYDRFDSTAAVAFIIGNEGNGLSQTARELTDTFVTIPMAGKTESLNAAVCASVLLFDAARKRRCR